MKKGIYLLLIVFLLFGFCGCKDKETVTTDKNEETETISDDAEAKEETKEEAETGPVTLSGDEYVSAVSEAFLNYGTSVGYSEIGYQDISELDQNALDEMHIADYRVLQMDDKIFQLIVIPDGEMYPQLKAMLAASYGLTANEQESYYTSENDDKNGYAMRLYAGENPYLLIGFLADGSDIDTAMDEFCAQLNTIGYTE